MTLTLPYLTDLAALTGGLEDIGFTGTAAGVTGPQAMALAEVLDWLRLGGALRLHHGWCKGADDVAARVAGRLARPTSRIRSRPTIPRLTASRPPSRGTRPNSPATA